MTDLYKCDDCELISSKKIPHPFEHSKENEKKYKTKWGYWCTGKWISIIRIDELRNIRRK